MTIDYIFERDKINDDALFELSVVLYEGRMAKKLTLALAAKQAKLTVWTIDRLESGLDSINFGEVCRLLNLYEVRLDCSYDCFPGLPNEVYERYFMPQEGPE